MSNSSENSSTNYMIIFGILTIFCLLFLILFRIEESPEGEDTQNTDLNLFQMIPSAKTKNPKILERVREDRLDIKELAARDDLDDPTIMSFPNKKYGFSAVLKENDEPPEPRIAEYSLPLQNVNAPLIERTPLVGIFPEPSTNDTGNLKTPEIGKIDLPETPKEIVSRLIWLENGREITPPVKLDEVKKAAAGKIPSAKTEVKIEKLSSSPVLFLVGKSGIEALDQLVMSDLRARLVKVFVGEIKPEALPDSVIVDWRLVLRDNKNP